MALPEFSMRQLLEAGVHYGHQTARWNPRMAEYIYGDRNGIHILDLTQTVPMLDQALKVVRDTVAKGGRILFVGTKRQAQKPIAEAAEKCAQYYMNHRWLGGTLTNWKTVSQSIQRLKQFDELLASGAEVNAQDKNGWSALMVAALHNPNPEVVAALLDAGADVKAKNSQDRDALWCARNPGVLRAKAIPDQAKRRMINEKIVRLIEKGTR